MQRVDSDPKLLLRSGRSLYQPPTAAKERIRAKLGATLASATAIGVAAIPKTTFATLVATATKTGLVTAVLVGATATGYFASAPFSGTRSNAATNDAQHLHAKTPSGTRSDRAATEAKAVLGKATARAASDISTLLISKGPVATAEPPRPRARAATLESVERVTLPGVATKSAAFDLTYVENDPTRGAKSEVAASPQTSQSPEPPSELSRETALIREANLALVSGNGKTALLLLEQHQQLFPRGALTEERVAALVMTRCLLHHVVQAQTTFIQFASHWPTSLLVPRVVHSCRTFGVELPRSEP